MIAYETFSDKELFDGDLGTLFAGYQPPNPDWSSIPAVLVPFVGRLLVSEPEDRYPNAEVAIHVLCEATDSPPPAETPLLRESFLQASTFVGRQTELATLETALEAAFEGQGSFWLVGGESGVGKSRLLDELRTRALVRGALVLRGGAVANGGLPYQVWRGAVPRLVLEADLTDFEAGILKPLVPDIDALLERKIPAVPELLGTANQERLISTLVELFRRHMHQAAVPEIPPIVLLLEDLQWVDQGIAAIRKMLTIRDQLPNLLLIGAYRDEERPTLPDELPGIQVLKLSRLSDEAVALLAAGMLGEAGRQPELVSLLARETEGNAFFLVEVVRALAADAGRLDQVGLMPLPDQVRAGGVERVVRSRIAHVPMWGQPMLQVAAAIGREINLAALDFIETGATDLLADHRLDEWLLACVDVNVFEVQDDQWRFSHDRIRGQVVDDIDPARAPVIHRWIGEAFEAAHGGDPNWAYVLYYHWNQANDPAKTLYYLDKVVEWMTWYSANYAEARDLILHGLDILPPADARRLNLLNHLSEGYWRTGQFAEATQVAEEALQLGLALNASGDIARSYGNLGIVCRLQGQYDQAHHFLVQSLRLRQSIGDEMGIARSYANLGINAYSQGNHAAAQDYYQRSYDLQRSLGDLQGMALNLNNIGQILANQGQTEQARRSIESGLEIARRLNHRSAVAFGLSSLGAMAMGAGDFPAACVLLSECLDAFNAIGDRYGAVYAMLMLSLALPPDDQHLRGLIADALQSAQEIGADAFVLLGLIGAIRYYLTHQNPAFGFQLAGLVRQHPALTSEIGVELDRALILVHEMELDQDFEAAMGAGAALELEPTVRTVLADLALDDV